MRIIRSTVTAGFRVLVHATAMIAALVGAPALAAAVTIGFDGFADFDNIHGVNLGGVTLFATDGNVEVFANGRIGIGGHSPPNVVASLTGTFQSNNPLSAVFDAPVTFVSFYAGDGGGDDDEWELLAFDAQVGGNLVASATSVVWSGVPYMELTVAGPSILRVEANWLDPTAGFGGGLGYDTLTFIPVPEPSTAFLLATGLVAMAVGRRMLVR